MPVELNKHVIKMAAERRDLDGLRDWILLRRYCAERSGLFTLDALADIYAAQGLGSLADRSNRHKFYVKKSKKISDSIFFQHIEGRTFKYHGLKAILVAHRGTAKHTAYHIDSEVLRRPGAFLDACIGLISAGGGYSSAGLAKLFNVSKRRIQKATAANDKAGTVRKRYNKIVEPYRTQSEALAAYTQLRSHGIGLNRPVKMGREWIITVNAVNSYTFATSKRFKGKTPRGSKRNRGAYSTNDEGRKWEKRHLQMYRGKGARPLRERAFMILGGKALVFNEPVYDLGAFILDHSLLFN